MTSEPTIHLLCGLVAAGKTTLARKLAEELPAVRLSRDEWMIRPYGLPHEDPAYVEQLASCTELLWDIELNVLGVGASVALDWNFWSRKLLQLADPGLELLDELTECAILGLKVDVARYAG